MTSTPCFSFLPKEVEMIIYKYEHQLKTIPVFIELLSLRNCDDCGCLHVNETNCYECGNHLCESCTPTGEDDDILCEGCMNEYFDRVREREEAQDNYEFIYGDF